MRAIKGATVMFGLANVPVDVCSAHTEKRTKLRTLHADCGTPVNQVYVCKVCNTEATQTIKGVQIDKTRMVFIEPEELQRFAAPRSAEIEVLKFVPLRQVELAMVGGSHWLQPHGAMGRQYETIVRALGRKRVAAFAVSRLWGKENPVVIVAHRGALMMHTLHCADETVQPDDIIDLLAGKVRPQELKLAEALIDTMSGDLEETDLRSLSREREQEFIAAKVAQEPVVFPDTPAPMMPTFDFAASMTASMEKMKQEKVKP